MKYAATLRDGGVPVPELGRGLRPGTRRAARPAPTRSARCASRARIPSPPPRWSPRRCRTPSRPAPYPQRRVGGGRQHPLVVDPAEAGDGLRMIVELPHLPPGGGVEHPDRRRPRGAGEQVPVGRQRQVDPLRVGAGHPLPGQDLAPTAPPGSARSPSASSGPAMTAPARPAGRRPGRKAIALAGPSADIRGSAAWRRPGPDRSTTRPWPCIVAERQLVAARRPGAGRAPARRPPGAAASPRELPVMSRTLSRWPTERASRSPAGDRATLTGWSRRVGQESAAPDLPPGPGPVFIRLTTRSSGQRIRLWRHWHHSWP